MVDWPTEAEKEEGRKKLAFLRAWAKWEESEWKKRQPLLNRLRKQIEKYFLIDPVNGDASPLHISQSRTTFDQLLDLVIEVSLTSSAEVRRCAEALCESFPIVAVESRPEDCGGGKYLSPIGAMVGSQYIVALREALALTG